MDTSGHLAIQPRFESAGPFIHGKATIIVGGLVGELSKDGTVFILPGTSYPTIPYHIDSTPPGAKVFVIPVLDYNKLNQIQVERLMSGLLTQYLRGTTGMDIDLFDQKYMVVFIAANDSRVTLLDVVAGSEIRMLSIAFK